MPASPALAVMHSTAFSFAVVFFVLLGAPFIAPAVAWGLSRAPASRQRGAFGALVLFVALVCSASVASVSTPLYELDLLLLAVGFLSATVLAVSTFRIRPRAWGFLAGGFSILVLAASLLMGTVGALGVLFVVGDTVPIYESEFNGKKCYVTSFGNATTSVNGYNVELKRLVPVLPVLEMTVDERHIEDPPYDPSQACAEALAEIAANKSDVDAPPKYKKLTDSGDTRDRGITSLFTGNTTGEQY